MCVQDVVTRYAHQSGFHVERRFGWDCHGLPVEYEIDKSIGIKVCVWCVSVWCVSVWCGCVSGCVVCVCDIRELYRVLMMSRQWEWLPTMQSVAR